jgi:hypothetical protein
VSVLRLDSTRDYATFLEHKTQSACGSGFAPLWMPDELFDFQKALTEWSLVSGRGALFADCGLGKTPMQLVWAENVVRKTNGRVLVATPLAVGHQTVREGDKFGVECRRSADGKPAGKITVTNYERLHLFDPNDFEGMVCDESSILKNYDGARRAVVTEFLRKMPYRLLCTATAAPNDYIELGTSSEALGELGHMDMLARFFKNEQANISTKRFHGEAVKWRLKKHAVQPFWRWVCSWARAMRRPSDLGFDDGRFVLPELIERETVIDNTTPLPGELFVRPAFGLWEQRQEARITLKQRCELAAEKVNHKQPAVVWCHLNDEGDLLERLIPDCVQVSGRDSDEVKEERLLAFQSGEARVIVIKPKIGAFGLNWQHCAHMTVFPSHSYEQYYQGVRRCWRFGQKRKVVVDVITTGGGLSVLKNLQRKATQADAMFSELVLHMNDALHLRRSSEFTKEMEAPEWL